MLGTRDSMLSTVNDVYSGCRHVLCSSNEECDSKTAVIRTISELFDDSVKRPVPLRGKRLPQVGEYLLINERETPLFSRIHGGRYSCEHCRRHFGRVIEVHPHIIVLESNGSITSEMVSDFNVGLIKFVRLKRLPERPISYDEKLLSTFVKSFENLLLE